MTKEEYNAFVDDNDLDVNSEIQVTYNNHKSEKVALYRKYAYEVEDRLSYPEKNKVKGQPPQIIVFDPATGTRGIHLTDVLRITTI